MSNTLKTSKPPIDWSYYLLMSLVALGVLILLGLAIAIPAWLINH